MASYGFSPSQVSGLIKLTDKVSNSTRLSVIETSDGHKRFSLRPTSVDIFALYGKDADQKRPTTASYQRVDEKVQRWRMSSGLSSSSSGKEEIESIGTDSDKTSCSKRHSTASKIRNRVSRIFT